MTTKMEIVKKHYLFPLSVVFSFNIFVVLAQNDQSGFINIDCGHPESLGNYTEPTTGLNFISDEPFVKTGVTHSVPEKSKAEYQRQVLTLRAFPEGIRNCYTIGVSKGTTYYISATFYYGNYDGKNKLPIFDIHLGANYWDKFEVDYDWPYFPETMHTPLQNHVRICVANLGKGTPFVSVIQLIPLLKGMYVTDSGLSLYSDTRSDLGSIPDMNGYEDSLDRDWYSDDANNISNCTAISTSSVINPDLKYKIPSEVMHTAITPTNPNDPLTYSWYSLQGKAYYMYLHFAEIKKLKENESRSFDIFVNGERFYGPLVLDYLNVTTISSTSPLPIVTKPSGSYTISLVRRNDSTLPPILNALELYTSLDLSQWETDQDDVDAITTIKSTYGVNRNWDGDPCAPIIYLWRGLTCSYDGSDPPRITTLNLSSSGLTGEISNYIFNLQKLESLDLSHNNLTGPVPQFLAQLLNLKLLNLRGNNFTGTVPAELIAKSRDGSLVLGIDHGAPVEREKRKKILIPVVASVGGFFILIAVAGILIGVKRINKQVALPLVSGVNIESDFQNGLKRQFTYSEVMKMTNGFEKVLGKGGFGTVYHGVIGNTQVAVKKLSTTSTQAYRQLQTEVKLLMTVHHRNLTSLVGYCREGDIILALIYEYMANGDLHSHLLGDRNADVMSWEGRIKIALDAAQGLEYLHNGCKPPIVHRDIKPTNILLTENFQAKLGDFGLSRSFPVESTSHVSTVVAGTPGYLDPEYSITNRLTEKSDVYSFGVVLLQIVTSRSAILSMGSERTHISDWVSSMLSNGDISSIVDQRLSGEFDNNSAWKVVEIAMACVSLRPNRRPNMNQVVSELTECLGAEFLDQINYTRTSSDPVISIMTMSPNVTSEFDPIAR